MSQFELLNDDTTILMIYQDTFTVARLKELISYKLYRKFTDSPENTRRSSFASSLRNSLVLIEEQNVRINMDNFQFTFPTDGMECKLLDFYTKQWKTGKLKIFTDVQVIPSGTHGYDTSVKINELKLEFAPDEPPLSDIETSLDEFRKQNLES
ncbi:KGK domain-containing protein [Lyngbya sp. PCC 8106]|uniref:KGK domain-containing protein n=1 Tax=Lyngbya sp. (strain PCC 8106) TaxID=313612 RepID=UPI0000EAA2D7|nr:KGK domain-containing protein [Lyngbya sp. PCC 8106]EAW36987.1 hypothetical protein L8106_21272 [Lyngbya sp. PCC 8106]